MPYAIRTDQKSGIFPWAATSATPKAPNANAAAHRASARVARLCSQDTTNKHAPTLSADAEVIKSVERLWVIMGEENAPRITTLVGRERSYCLAWYRGDYAIE